MRKDTNEMFFQLVALMLAIILVHAVYVTVVRPNADSIIKTDIWRNRRILEIRDIGIGEKTIVVVKRTLNHFRIPCKRD